VLKKYFSMCADRSAGFALAAAVDIAGPGKGCGGEGRS